MNSFFNTIGETGKTLSDSVSNALSQEEKILVFMSLTPMSDYTAFELLKLVNFKFNTPITSVRRALNCLERDSKLVNTGKQRLGDYGKMCGCYKLL